MTDPVGGVTAYRLADALGSTDALVDDDETA
jgi:hypothetical protein